MHRLRRNPGENDEQYIWRIGTLIDEGVYDGWSSILDSVNEQMGLEPFEYKGESAYRKRYRNARKFYDNCFSNMAECDNETLQKIKEERMRLQTLNIERNRLDRHDVRKELYYEYIGSAVKQLDVPKFVPVARQATSDAEYVLTIADLHYGATFKSMNNEYSPAICNQRMGTLLALTIKFVKDHKLNNIKVLSLGDIIQGILRINDLKLNDSTVVKSVVEVSRLIANFLNELSKYVYVDYYHVPNANHTQIRVLGAKANELADEDLEYIISNYISDLLSNNERVSVHLADDGCNYINIDSKFGFNILAMHGHQIKNIESSIRDLSMVNREFIDYLFLGHYHSGKEIPCNEGETNDTEVLISPAFIGSDPYSDSLLKGNKSSVKIYGFTEDGHTETYKFILN